MRVRWNILNLYIHLCWQTVEQQFNPALAIASSVSIKFRNHGNLQNINILRLFRSLKVFPDRNMKLTKQNSFHDSFYFLARLTGMNSRLGKLSSTILPDNFAWQLCSTSRFDCFARQFWESGKNFSERLSMNFSCHLRI